MHKNQRLVKKIAEKYVGAYGNDLDCDDHEQVGYIGLLTAAEKYDAGCETKFSTYAVHWIKREILHEIKARGFSIKHPAKLIDKIAKCVSLDTSFMQKGLERNERLQAIADTLDMSVDDVKKCLSMRKQYQETVSLNTIVDDDNQTEIYEYIPDANAPHVEEEIDRNALY